MKTFKKIFAITAFAAASAANATMYNVSGNLTSVTNTLSGLTIYQSPVLFNGIFPSTFPGDSPIAVNGTIDITGSTISGGSLTIADRGMYVSLTGPNLAFGSAFDAINSSLTFTGSGAGWMLAETYQNCVGVNNICGFTNLGLPVGYNLTSANDQQWTLLLTSDSNGTTTVHNFSLTSVPVPASAWLFGSSVIGLVRVARKRKTL